MNREEAIAFYHEIMYLCKDMNLRAINLMESKTDDSSAQGYQIRIRASFDGESSTLIEQTAKKYGLALKKENGEVVVFKPKRSSKQIILTS